MSISSATSGKDRIKSPVKYYITFKGNDGVFTYWDGEDRTLDSLEFVVMDTRSSITGWSDEHNARISSNLVRSTKNEFRVRAGSTALFTGPYATDKEKIKSLGGKFTTNIFALATIDGIPTPVNIQLNGACLREWSEFVEQTGMRKLYTNAVVATKSDQKKKGAVKFYTPVFTLANVADSELADAKQFDSESLQPYLTQDEK